MSSLTITFIVFIGFCVLLLIVSAQADLDKEEDAVVIEDNMTSTTEQYSTARPSVICTSPELEHSEFDLVEWKSVYIPGEKTTLKCRYPDKTFIGSPLWTCGADGFWRFDLKPDCEVIPCPKPSALEHGSVLLWKNESEVLLAIYDCDDGYVLDPPIVDNICQDNKQWEHPTPQCKVLVHCGNVSVDHGTATVHCDYLGCQTYVHCVNESGQEQEEYFILVCDFDGQWRSLHDRDECPDPSFTTTSDVTTQFSRSVAPADQSDNDSSPMVFHFKFNCPLPTQFQYGKYKYSNGIITYFCPYPFILVGRQMQHCLPTGDWSDVVPTCVHFEAENVKFSAEQGAKNWLALFNYFANWTGSYTYMDKTYTCSLYSLNKGTHDDELIDFVLEDGTAVVNLRALRLHSSLFFELIHIVRPNKVFLPNHSWTMVSALRRMEGTLWKLEAVAFSGQILGFTQFKLVPMPKQSGGISFGSRDGNYKSTLHAKRINALAITGGVLIAVAAIILAGIGAAMFVRRYLPGSSHRQPGITSFENPVYNYERHEATAIEHRYPSGHSDA